MFFLLFGIFTRIFSNSFLNVFQKMLTNSGEKSSVVNFYSYLGLTILSLCFCRNIIYESDFLIYIIIMGLLGALGNYFIIKALSVGDLSELAPINSYKPVVALVFGMLVLSEIPSIKDLFGIILIITGTFLLFNKKITHTKALFYRFLALIFSASEAIIIKKIILISNIDSAFAFWAFSGLIFSFILVLKYPLKLSKISIKYQIALILSAGIMQYATNYVFSKMNVAYALALFQLSTILSVFLGVNIFKEKNLVKKIAASFIMISGAILIILNQL